MIALFAVLAGLAVGSFANVVASRIPEGRSLLRPPSTCPACGERIRPYDNVPLLSWVLLRGRCRHCHAAISLRYPLVELATGLVWLGIVWRYGTSWTALIEMLASAGLICLAAVDAERLILPKRIVYADLALVATVGVLATAYGGDLGRLERACTAALAAWVVAFLVNTVAPRTIGFGDVRLMLLVGFATGWLGVGEVIVAVFAALASGSFVAVILLASGRADRRSVVPFGVFLAIGSTVSMLAGSAISAWYTTSLLH